jgi:hypothetical protein
MQGHLVIVKTPLGSVLRLSEASEKLNAVRIRGDGRKKSGLCSDAAYA